MGNIVLSARFRSRRHGRRSSARRCGEQRRLVAVAGSIVAAAALASLLPAPALAAGTPAGTVIDSTAEVEFDFNGARSTVQSNTVSVTVDEIVDVAVTVQTPQLLVTGGDTARGLLFTLTNTGNGNETFSLVADSALAGDQFDPVPATPSIYFDSDASGDLTVGDVAYAPGSNDPALNADEAVNLLLVNDIPAGPADGASGLSALIVTAATASGAPGTVVAGAGDGGVDAVVGSSGGSATDTGEYLVAAAQLEVVKSVTIADPFGGAEPVPGATLTYTVTVQVTSGTATNSVFTDPIPANTTYVPASMALNAAALTDAADADAGEFEATANAVVINLGDLTTASPQQTITFDVTID